MAERIRFYFDQHIPAPVAQGLQRRGLDVLTAQAADRCGLSDSEQIEWAEDVLDSTDMQNHIEFL